MSTAMRAKAAQQSKKGKSEDLSKTAKRDGEEYQGYNEDDDGEDERDMFERARQQEASRSIWREGGKQKDMVLQTLIQQFGMIVQKPSKDDLDEDNENAEENGSDSLEGQFIKLPSASKAIMRISE